MGCCCGGGSPTDDGLQARDANTSFITPKSGPSKSILKKRDSTDAGEVELGHVHKAKARFASEDNTAGSPPSESEQEPAEPEPAPRVPDVDDVIEATPNMTFFRHQNNSDFRYEDYYVVVDRTEGQDLGVQFVPLPETLSIVKIKWGGLFDKWNEENPGFKVTPHDHVIEVNGVGISGKMMLGQLAKDKPLRIKVRRELPGLKKRARKSCAYDPEAAGKSFAGFLVPEVIPIEKLPVREAKTLKGDTRWEIKGMYEHQAVKLGLRNLDRMFSGDMSDDDSSDDSDDESGRVSKEKSLPLRSRKSTGGSGAPGKKQWLMNDKLIKDLVAGSREFVAVSVREIAAAQPDLRKMNLQDLLRLRVNNLEVVSRSEVHDYFLATVDDMLFMQIGRLVVDESCVSDKIDAEGEDKSKIPPIGKDSCILLAAAGTLAATRYWSWWITEDTRVFFDSKTFTCRENFPEDHGVYEFNDYSKMDSTDRSGTRRWLEWQVKLSLGVDELKTQEQNASAKTHKPEITDELITGMLNGLRKTEDDTGKNTSGSLEKAKDEVPKAGGSWIAKAAGQLKRRIRAGSSEAPTKPPDPGANAAARLLERFRQKNADRASVHQDATGDD